MADGGNRRSARISALEEKARVLALERKAKAKAAAITAPKRRAPKRRSLHHMYSQEGESENEETARNQPLQGMPSKFLLEFILDLIMQRKYPMTVHPSSDPDQVRNNQGNDNDLKDFGAIRAKIMEGMYTNMAQFERDISLVTKNPLDFSSAATFLSEARTISKLADQLFSPLRTEREKYTEDSQERSDGKKLLGEAIKNAKLKNSICINDPFQKRNTYFASSSRNNDLSDKRYMNCDGPVLSLELKEPKMLELQAPQADSAYIKSYLSFLSGLGPKAKQYGSRHLSKCLNESSLLQKSNPSTPVANTADLRTQRRIDVGSIKPYTYLRGANAGPDLEEPPHPRGGNGGLLPPNVLFKSESSFKGKEIAMEGGMNSINTFGGINSNDNCPPWEANKGRSGNNFFLGEMINVDRNKFMDFNTSSANTTGEDEDNHLLFATLLHDNSPCIRNLSPGGSGQFSNVLPTKMVTPNYEGWTNFSVHPSHLPSSSSVPKHSAGSMMFPIQVDNIPSSSTPVASFPILSPSTPPSTLCNRAGSMNFPIQSSTSALPGANSKGKGLMTPPAGLEYYKNPQPPSSRNTATLENPYFESVNETTGPGFSFMDLLMDGDNNDSAFSPDKYTSKSSEDVQIRAWNQPASWGLQTTFDPPKLQTHVIEQNPRPRYSFMQLLQGIPQEQDFLDEISFPEPTNPQAHQLATDSRSIWDGTPSMPINLELNELPDLNLQL